MPRINRSAKIFVSAPLQAVFDYVSDISKHPEWSEGELKIDAVTSDPIGVGKEYLSKGQVGRFQKDRPNKLKVTAYEPPNRFGFITRDPSFGDIIHIFIFAEQNGGTLITRTMTFSLNPVIALAFRILVFPTIGKPATEKSLARLKVRLESPPTA